MQNVELQQRNVRQQSLEYNLKRLQQGPLGMSASTSSQGVCTSMEEVEKRGRSLLVSRSRGASADDMPGIIAAAEDLAMKARSREWSSRGRRSSSNASTCGPSFEHGTDGRQMLRDRWQQDWS